MNLEQISKPDRAVTFVRLSYGCLLAEAIDIVFAVYFGFASDGMGDINNTVLTILWLLVFILPLIGTLFGGLGARFSSTEYVSKKAYRAGLLNLGVFVLILLLAILGVRSGCACGNNGPFYPISSTLPS